MFARELSFYIVTIYVPCFMIVVVSWFSFWLDYKAVSFTFADDLDLCDINPRTILAEL